MVIKVKVSDVAKDFGKSNKEIIELLDKYCGGPAKKASTVLEENELNILFDKITIQNSVKSFDAYFKSGAAKAKKEKPAAKKQDKPAKKAETAKDKKRESQAAILQMAEQAAKRAEEKAKKKAEAQPQARTKGEARHIDTRVNNVDLEKYNQKYEDIAPASSMGDFQKKQKLNQKSKQYRKKKPQGIRAHSKGKPSSSALPELPSKERSNRLKFRFPRKLPSAILQVCSE